MSGRCSTPTPPCWRGGQTLRASCWPGARPRARARGSLAWLTRRCGGRAVHIGYVPDENQEALFASARALVLPSLDEGFGLPALAAMSAGIPVVASRRGSLPEVVGEAGTLVDPQRPEEIAAALERLLTDEAWAVARAQAGLERARAFSWAESVVTLRRAYLDAVSRRAGRV